MVKEIGYDKKGSHLLRALLAVDHLGPELAPLEVSHLDQKTNLNQLTEDISQLMERYNGTVSWCFLGK
jgi:hypothetical protein